MIIGCFALVEPFTSMRRQFEAIREMGIDYADLTDNHHGATLGATYGFAASLSLDGHPARVREMVDAAGLTLTSVCAHANLLDPPSPDVYGTFEIIKAIRLAKLLGIKHVITTEADPSTEFGHNLTPEQRIFAICEKLYTPIEWAEELGIWKDMGPEWVEKRGTLYGCGMATIALGEGVIDLPEIIAALKDVGFDGATTLEVAGPDNVKLSAQRLREWIG